MEINRALCKICNELKFKKENGRYPGSGGKNKRFTDLNDKEWSGRVCPDCHRNNAKKNMKAARLPNET